MAIHCFIDFHGGENVMEEETRAWRPGPEEKLAVKKPNTRYYPGTNLGQARKLFSKAQQGLKESKIYEGREKLKQFQGLVGAWANFPDYWIKARTQRQTPGRARSLKNFEPVSAREENFFEWVEKLKNLIIRNRIRQVSKKKIRSKKSTCICLS